jgi:hypothetical protein
VTALIAVLALCLRLAWPAPPLSLIGPADFGEHALCLAAGSDAPPPGNNAPADHADHDGLGCCVFHVASGAAPPLPGMDAPVAFAAIALPPPPDQPYRAPAYPPGTSPARAPPFAI